VCDVHLWCSVASIAAEHDPRVAGGSAGADAEAAPGPDPRHIEPLGLRQQALEVDGSGRDLLSWLQF